MMHTDAGSLKEAANNAIQTKQQGELQPESGAMRTIRGELLQMQKCLKKVDFKVIHP
jgi:hypothetical protein